MQGVTDFQTNEGLAFGPLVSLDRFFNFQGAPAAVSKDTVESRTEYMDT